MLCLGPVQLALITLCVLSTPALGKPWESTTARYNAEGHNVHANTQNPSNPSHPLDLLTSISNRIFALTQNRSNPDSTNTYSTRHSKAPRDENFYRETHIFEDRKLKSSSSKNVARPLNKTLQVKVSSSSSNKIRPLVKRTTTVRTPVKLVIKATRPTTRVPTTKRKVPVVKRKRRPQIQAPKNFTEVKVSTSNKSKPLVHKIVTKWADKSNFSEVKQSWYDVPPANPQPEIISYSPEFPINNLASTEAPLSESPPTASSTPETALSNPINQFSMDVLPSSLANAAEGGGGGSDCPTVHISSAMLAPLQRQGCSDISVVLNSHFHQAANAATQRAPTPEPLGDVEAVEADPGLAEADPGLAEADPGVEQADAPAAPAADAPAPAADPAGGGGQPGGGGSSGGSGGFPSLPTLPEAPEFPSLPEFDLKGMMDFLGWIGGGLGHLLSFFKNPWLYIIPITLFFLKGFLIVMGLFPWWIPGLVLFAGVKSKSNVAHYKHVHPPVYHPDGWFWNHNTKTWVNVANYGHHRRRVQSRNFNYEIIPKLIEQFASRLSENSQSWKRRKKNSRRQGRF